MSDIGPIQSAGPLAAQLSKGPVSVSIPAAGATRASDQVELSDGARWLSQLASMPDVRQDKIDLAKARMESGFYDNESVIDATVDMVANEIGG